MTSKSNTVSLIKSTDSTLLLISTTHPEYTNLTSMLSPNGVPIAKETFIMVFFLANLFVIYGDVNECVAPKSNNTLAYSLSMKIVPITAMLDA